MTDNADNNAAITANTDPELTFDPDPTKPYALGREAHPDDPDNPAAMITVELKTQADALDWVNTQRVATNSDDMPDMQIINPAREERIFQFVHEMTMHYGLKACMDDLAELIAMNKLNAQEAEIAINTWHKHTAESLNEIIELFRDTNARGARIDAVQTAKHAVTK